MSSIPQKIKKNIETISALKGRIDQWQKLDNEELLLTIKDFEKKPRLEVSTFYNELFNDSNLVHSLIEIYKNHPNNSKLVVYIVSAVGNLIQRYDVTETKEVYDFMLENAYKKNVGSYVALFLPRLKHFKNYDKKWQYLMDVKEMTPKKVAENSFEGIIDLFIDEIPEEFKTEVKEYFLKKSSEASNEYGKQHYLVLAKMVLDR